MGYGMDKSRFLENKRAVEDKYLGPLVSTIMTVHTLTRCIRFAQEVAGVPELGATGRASIWKRGRMWKKPESEMSGNMWTVPGRSVDIQTLCLQGPVLGTQKRVR